jgi:hypothetical protein
MSKTDIDLNIENYDINDLISFLHLKKNYTSSDLEDKEKEYIYNVVSNDTGTINSKKKFELIMFIKNAKTKLLDNIIINNNNNNNNNSGTNNNSRLGGSNRLDGSNRLERAKDFDLLPGENPNLGGSVMNPNVVSLSDPTNPSQAASGKDSKIQLGQIINPFSNLPAMEFSKNAIKMNGYNPQRIIRNYIFNTRFRDAFSDSYSTNSTYTLPQKMVNVISIVLSGLQFPNFMFSFSKSKKTNQIFIHEDVTDNEAMVSIPSGNYNVMNFPGVLEKAINEQVVGSYTPAGPNRFTVSISPYTFFTTISNSTYTFTMITNFTLYNDDPDNFVCPNVYSTRYFKSEPDIKDGTRPEQYFNSLGWLIGYRLTVYEGLQSYTSEGPFDNQFADYIYFTLNDYVNNQTANTYGVLGGSILDANILGVIPITTPYFTSTFDNNSNFIYKTRNYTGPVNIAKINIQLINEFGEQINLHNSDFAFCLQVTSILDPY